MRISWIVFCICCSQLRKSFETPPLSEYCRSFPWIQFLAVTQPRGIDLSPDCFYFWDILPQTLPCSQPLSHLSLVPSFQLSCYPQRYSECSKLSFFFFLNSLPPSSLLLISKPVYATLFYFSFFHTYFFYKYPQDLVWYHNCILFSFLPFLGSLSQFFHLKCVSVALKN